MNLEINKRETVTDAAFYKDKNFCKVFFFGCAIDKINEMKIHKQKPGVHMCC